MSYYYPETYIYNEGDRKVRFLNRNGYAIQLEYANKAGLVEGNIYSIREERVDKFHTSYKLYGTEGTFNSVMFERV